MSPQRQILKRPGANAQGGNNVISLLEAHCLQSGSFTCSVQFETQRDREGGEWNWVCLVVGGDGGAESTQGQVHGPTESERARSPAPKPHTPPTAQAKTMGACAQLPDARGMAGHQVAPIQLCQPPPPPWDHAALSLKRPALELHSAPTQSQSPPSPGGRELGGSALTTVLLRWLWTVKSGQKSKSAMARSRDSARGRAFSSSSSPCSGHSAQGHLSGSWPRRGGPRTWGKGGGRRLGPGGHWDRTRADWGSEEPSR